MCSPILDCFSPAKICLYFYGIVPLKWGNFCSQKYFLIRVEVFLHFKVEREFIWED